MPENRHILGVAGDSVEPTVGDGDIVLVELSRTAPTPPGIFVRFDGLGLVAKRREHVANSEPPPVRILSDNPVHAPDERSAEAINIVGMVRWFAREI